MGEDSWAARFNRILMATDFSDASRKALRYAAAITGFNGARLYIVRVVSSVRYAMDHDPVGYTSVCAASTKIQVDSWQIQRTS